MYKIEKYKFTSDTTEDFVKGRIYYLRRTKKGTGKYLTTERNDFELQIDSGKISLISDYNKSYLKNNFINVGVEFYNNHKDYEENKYWGSEILSNVILGVIDNDEYRRKYTKSNVKSKHVNNREDRIELSVDNANPVYYYEVLRKKDNVRQVHCLYEDSTLIVFNKEDGKIITVMLLGRNKLEQYLKIAEDNLSNQPVMNRCAKLHDKLIIKKSNEITEDILNNIVNRKTKYIGNDWYLVIKISSRRVR